MRITEQIRFDRPRAHVADARERLAVQQERLSTGRRINRPSDDPIGAFRARMLDSDNRRVGQHGRNLIRADSSLRHADGTLGQAVQSLLRIKELVIQGATSVVNDQDASDIVTEIDSARQHLRTLANTRSEGRYIFAGFRTSTAPYGEDFGYDGDDNAFELEVVDGLRVESRLPGVRIFGGEDDDGPPGRIGVFGVIESAMDAVTAGDEDAIEDAIENLEAAIDQVVGGRTEIGVRMSRVEAAQAIHDRLEARLPEDLADLRDTDFTVAVSELSLAETAFQAVLAVSGRELSSGSLMEFLR